MFGFGESSPAVLAIHVARDLGVRHEWWATELRRRADAGDDVSRAALEWLALLELEGPAGDHHCAFYPECVVDD